MLWARTPIKGAYKRTEHIYLSDPIQLPHLVHTPALPVRPNPAGSTASNVATEHPEAAVMAMAMNRKSPAPTKAPETGTGQYSVKWSLYRDRQ